MAKKKAKSKPKKTSKSKASKKPKSRKTKASARKSRRATKPAKRSASKKPIAKPSAKPAVQKTRLGEVTHFYSHLSVAVVKVENSIKTGDKISIEGATTNFKQKVDSMQIDLDKISEAKKGQEIGMKVIDKVREGDVVFKG